MAPDFFFYSEIQHSASKKSMKITIQVLISSDRVARLSILMSHLIGLFNTLVMRCYLMVPETIFIVKFNTRLQIKYENET